MPIGFRKTASACLRSICAACFALFALLAQIILFAFGVNAALFMPHMQQGLLIAIKTRALERCREMDLHPNSSRVLALTLLRTGSESNCRKYPTSNCKPHDFNG